MLLIWKFDLIRGFTHTQYYINIIISKWLLNLLARHILWHMHELISIRWFWAWHIHQRRISEPTQAIAYMDVTKCENHKTNQKVNEEKKTNSERRRRQLTPKTLQQIIRYVFGVPFFTYPKGEKIIIMNARNISKPRDPFTVKCGLFFCFFRFFFHVLAIRRCLCVFFSHRIFVIVVVLWTIWKTVNIH